jgi:hypothetical protein
VIARPGRGHPVLLSASGGRVSLCCQRSAALRAQLPARARQQTGAWRRCASREPMCCALSANADAAS